MLIKARAASVENGRIGVISDTHGLIRPEALNVLRAVELIIHAGDIGTDEVLAQLQKLARVIAIKGNNDVGPWARRIPDAINLRLNGTKAHVIHDVHDWKNDVSTAGVRIVISGHSHKPGIITRNDVLFVNPGSAGPRRFKL
ncbi:MAG: metallophosphoesterase family protein, partial [Candidatus Binatia bacterium]